jgi:hypothetical protein
MKGLVAIIAAVAVALFSYDLGSSHNQDLNDCPGGQCQRTIPFSATTAPIFDAPPAAGVAPVVGVQVAPPAVVSAPVVTAPVVVAPSTGVEITPEQKEALKAGFIQLALLAFGIFAGRGTTSPIVTQIIATVLEFLKSRQPAAPKAPASTRKRVSRRK